LKIAFMGTPAYAIPTLNALVEAGHEIVTVVAQPDRPSGRGKKLQSPPVALRARELGLNLRQPKALRSGPFFENFQRLEIDLAIVIAYGRILPKAILETPRLGCWNAHGSLLPRWRGAAPIERAVHAGDTETGVCLMQMDDGLDTGDILAQVHTPISEDERAIDLRQRLSQLSAELIVGALGRIETLTATPQSQTGVLHAAPMKKSESILDFGRSATTLHNQIRAFFPWPGSQTVFRGEQFKIHRAQIIKSLDTTGLPGEILVAKKRMIVACGKDALEIMEAQLPGKKALPIQSILNGARIQVGEFLNQNPGETP
jgi:methionyl-tRNA formyltransferase